MADKIKKTTAQGTIEKVSIEVHALEPSTPISLYELDISEIKKNLHLGTSLTIPEDYLRFHNMEVIGQETIIFRGEVFHPMPIQTEGFELASDGSMPRPTLTFTSLKGITEFAKIKSNFQALKRCILELENMIGAKVTRIRTFLKYLDPENTFEGVGQFTGTNPELPRDIYFVNRKIEESKNFIKLELSSVLELENFKLPGRFCLASRCPWNYRGEGCAYEYDAEQWENSTDPPAERMGNAADQLEAFGHNKLPKYAPPVANADDLLISGFGNPDAAEPDYDGDDPWVGYDITNIHTRISGEYVHGTPYPTGAIVFIQKSKVKYYYISKGNPDTDPSYGDVTQIPPPHSKYWEADRCSKTIGGCKIRHGAYGAAQNDDPGGAGHVHDPGEGHEGHPGRIHANKFLPFGGFPGTNAKTVIQ